MADRVRVQLLVAGRVQGVGFRFATVDEGRRLGLRGWVRNLGDGRVEAEAEGERAAVEALIAFCRRGPPAARVDGVEVRWLPWRGELEAFAARH
ncbi:MAG TPA: acylphosphatase [Anaeromyxobacter sp.]|nr:acylphosphatase [Anaeromyxobacter sp.]